VGESGGSQRGGAEGQGIEENAKGGGELSGEEERLQKGNEEAVARWHETEWGAGGAGGG